MLQNVYITYDITYDLFDKYLALIQIPVAPGGGGEARICEVNFSIAKPFATVIVDCWLRSSVKCVAREASTSR
jgi:hypothetical protein